MTVAGRQSGWSRPSSHQKAYESHEDEDDGQRAPPVLPKRRNPVSAFSPGPEEAEQQQQTSDNATRTPHALKAISTARSSPRNHPRSPRGR